MAVPEIGTPYATDTSLIKLGWDAKLVEESATQDIFSDNQGIYDDADKQVPDAVMMTVREEKGITQRTIGMLNRLGGAGKQGDADLRANEDTQATREITIYANEWFNGVSTDAYGLAKVKQDPYGIYKLAQPQLSMWAKETKGKKIRQAICEFRDSAQTDAAGASLYGLGLASRINPNLLVSGAAAPVVYDSTAADYAEAIGDSIAGATPSALSIARLNEIEELAATVWEIEPVTINGQPTWIVVVPSRQKRLLRTPGSGTLFELLKDGDVRGANNRAITGAFGRYGNLLLVEDPRAPIFTVGGSNGSWTAAFAYKGAGQTDGRTLTAASTRFDVAMVLGKGAVIDYEVEALHFEQEVQKYGRKIGLGAFTTQGYTRADFDVLASPTDTSIRNQSSALILCKSS